MEKVELSREVVALIVSSIMLVGGLLLFFVRLHFAQQRWRTEFVQVVGVIFFFPTLIVLAIFLDISKDALIGILGAIVGGLFARPGALPLGTGGPGETEGAVGLRRENPRAGGSDVQAGARTGDRVGDSAVRGGETEVAVERGDEAGQATAAQDTAQSYSGRIVL